MYNVHCRLYIVQCTLYSIRLVICRIAYDIQRIIYVIYCTKRKRVSTNLNLNAVNSADSNTVIM